MTHRAPAFSSPQHLLTNSERLSALRSRLADISADLETLAGQTEGERKESQALRDAVLQKFGSLGEV